MKIWLVVTLILVLWTWLAKRSWMRWVVVFFTTLLILGIYISWSQYESGCRFGIGECYAEKASSWHEWLKLAYVLVSEISWGGMTLALTFITGKKILRRVPKFGFTGKPK